MSTTTLSATTAAPAAPILVRSVTWKSAFVVSLGGALLVATSLGAIAADLGPASVFVWTLIISIGILQCLMIAEMAAFHRQLVAAETERRWPDAVRSNWLFHHRLYEAADMPELLAILDDIWMRNGPLLNYLYPHARPTYPGAHEHLTILKKLRARDDQGVKLSVQTDMIQGGKRLVELLERSGDTRRLQTDMVESVR